VAGPAAAPNVAVGTGAGAGAACGVRPDVAAEVPAGGQAPVPGLALPAAGGAPNPARPQGPAAGSALVIGDSIALGSADSLRRALGEGTTVDAKVGRQFSAAPGIVAAWTAVNDGPIVVDLGANGTVAADDVAAVIAAAGGRRLVLVGVHVPRRWQDGNNAALRAAAAGHPTVAFVDWDALVDANPGVLGPDGVHPGVTGRTLLATAVAAAAHKP